MSNVPKDIDVTSGVRHTAAGDEEITLIRSPFARSPFKKDTTAETEYEHEHRPEVASPVEAAGKATSGSDLLRRLVLTDAAREDEKKKP
ncbi:hypothetical protein KEM56_005591 [Ascosphaera pollenicola]|nr:hypothetical protein KEM56_005591 [Ascosphaera pollenicola]